MRRWNLVAAGLGLALGAAACSASGGAPDLVRVTPRAGGAGPEVLCVIAHPDDEAVFAATVYAIGEHLGGACDVAVLTNGEGGYKYSTLAEPLYGVALTEERVGRRELPAIRRAEMLESARILGVRDVHFLDQQDHRYTRDAAEVLAAEVLAADAGVWDLELVERRLVRILRDRSYDFVFTMAPVPETHGHHKAATVLALRAVGRLPARDRPVTLCARSVDGDGPPPPLPGLADHPITRVRPDSGPWTFDRTRGFGFRKRLDFRIVVNWVIAAHRSQGTMQLLVNRGEEELFHLFAVNPEDAPARATELFRSLAEAELPEPLYGKPDAADAPGR